MLQDAFNNGQAESQDIQKQHAKLHTDLGLDLHNGLSNCDNHSLIGQHAFQMVQQLLQSCLKKLLKLLLPQKAAKTVVASKTC